MDLSDTKCVALGSSQPIAARVVTACRAFLPLRAVRVACSLGVGIGGGRRSATQSLRKRLSTFRARLPRFAAIRRLAVHTAKLLRTGGTAAMTYGEASVGVAPQLLQAQRVAAAKALGDRTCGGDLDLTLAVADGARGGMADPAFRRTSSPSSRGLGRYGTGGCLGPICCVLPLGRRASSRQLPALGHWCAGPLRLRSPQWHGSAGDFVTGLPW